PWSPKLPDRIAAVRQLLMNAPKAWSLPEATAAFRRADAKDLEVVLECLAGLGLAVAYGAEHERRWRAASKLSA
ncbi:MAG: hypothetical protein ACYC8T_25650, partial [Myxococcaceae bacterium]